MPHLIAVLEFAQSHILGIVLAFVATVVIGFLWYGPLFGKTWMQMNNLPKPKNPTFTMMLPGLIANLVLVVVQSAVLGRTFQIVDLPDIWNALIIATIIWLPFTALVIINNNTWSNKPAKLTAIDCGYTLASTWAIAAVLYATL